MIALSLHFLHSPGYVARVETTFHLDGVRTFTPDLAAQKKILIWMRDEPFRIGAYLEFPTILPGFSGPLSEIFEPTE